MKKPDNRGYSLIEVLVAAAVIAVSLVSVVAFVRKGQEMIAQDKHRRMARAIVEQVLEDPMFTSDNYPNLTTGTTITCDTLELLTTPVTGYDTLTIAAPDSSLTGYGGIIVPRRVVTITIAWLEPGKTVRETIKLNKWVTQW